jgi:leucyl aminopeptidase
MQTMKIQFNKKIGLSKGIIVLPVFHEDLKDTKGKYPSFIESCLVSAVKFENFKADFCEIYFTHVNENNFPTRLLIIGVGSSEKFNASKIRSLGAKIAKIAKQTKNESISFLMIPKLEAFTEELTEGLLLLQYDIGIQKVKSKKPSTALKTIEFVVDGNSKDLESKALKAQNITEAVTFVKDLVNNPSNVVTIDYLAKAAEKVAKDNKYKFTVLGLKELKKMGWGGVLAVNQGSENEPKCVVMEYNGAVNPKEKPIVLIGKGVVFDTGGYNIKLLGAIETMHQDMAGAAAVYGVMSLLKKLGIKKNIVAITPIVENLISANAFRPSDIITMLSGHTVEITNTDGEGRLILADAITYGHRFDPKYMISIATLTGAVSVSLGDRYAAVLGNTPKLQDMLSTAGKQVDELVWPLPIHPDYKKKLNSTVADLKNRDPATYRLAGTAKGAAFLGNFFDKQEWCHIDIGGTAFTSDPQEFQTMGATAHGLRLLVKFLENL